MHTGLYIGLVLCLLTANNPGEKEEGWTDGWMNEWMDGQTDGLMDGFMDG